MNRVDKLTRSATALIVFALIGKVMGFARESLIASYFGAGVETDAFNAALRSTNLLTAVVSNAIANTFIPMLSKVKKEEGEESIKYHTNNMLFLSIIIGLIMAVLGVLISPIIVNIVGGGFNDETYNLTLQLTKLGMPVIIFAAIVGVMTGFLQSKGHFGATGAIPIPLNLVYIIYLLFLSRRFGIYGLTIASVLGIVAQAIFLYPETKKAGHKYFPVIDIKDKYVRHALELSIPVLLSVAINDVNIVVNTRFASSLATGTVSWLNNANKLNILVLGIFVSAITAVAFPILSKNFSEGDMVSGRKSMAAGTRLILLITIPAMVGLIVLAQPIVEIAFMRNKFTQFDADMTAQALVFYAPALSALSLNILLNRVYYSLQDTKTPLIISGVSVLLNVVFNYFLVRIFGHRGLALGLSIATNLSVLTSFIILRRKLGHFYGFSYLRAIIKNMFAAIIMGFIAYYSYFGLISLVPSMEVGTMRKLIVLLFAVFNSVLTYGVISYILGVGEVKMLVDMIKGKLKKN
ncbi:MAG: murein biosynthesis integral membrane protein MurJ [Tissierellia bacterium]|nr:murein biosynthesis integral membrane protein MurJ [Tissierellia bacterium]